MKNEPSILDALLAVGENIFDLYGGATSSRTTELHRTMRDGTVINNASVQHGVYWDTFFLPARREDGSIAGAVTVSMNVTEQKRAEEELRSKLELIQKQQEVIRSLGAPILQVWDDVLTMPVVGIVDSSRAAEIMDNLLQEVSRTRARFGRRPSAFKSDVAESRRALPRSPCALAAAPAGMPGRPASAAATPSGVTYPTSYRRSRAVVARALTEAGRAKAGPVFAAGSSWWPGGAASA